MKSEFNIMLLDHLKIPALVGYLSTIKCVPNILGSQLESLLLLYRHQSL